MSRKRGRGKVRVGEATKNRKEGGCEVKALRVWLRDEKKGPSGEDEGREWNAIGQKHELR